MTLFSASVSIVSAFDKCFWYQGMYHDSMHTFSINLRLIMIFLGCTRRFPKMSDHCIELSLGRTQRVSSQRPFSGFKFMSDLLIRTTKITISFVRPVSQNYTFILCLLSVLFATNIPMKDKKSWTGIIFVSVSVYFCKKIIRLFPHFTLEHTPSPHGRQHHPQSVFQDCEVFKQKKKKK